MTTAQPSRTSDSAMALPRPLEAPVTTASGTRLTIEVEVNFKSSMHPIPQLLTITDVARRSGFAASALRYYERLGLISSERSAGGRRRYPRIVLRRLAFIRAARHVGLSLEEIRASLATLPVSGTPARADWTRISRSWKQRLDTEIDALVALRDGLDSCIGCGCLSLRRCKISNPGDVASRHGPGAVYLPRRLREPLPEHGGLTAVSA